MPCAHGGKSESNTADEGRKVTTTWRGVAAEVEIIRVHVAEELVLGENYIDPQKWSPLIYNFRHYFRLAENELGKTFPAERQDQVADTAITHA